MTSPLVRVIGLARPFWRGMLLAVVLGVLTIGSSLSLMATSAWLISKAALQPSIAELSVAVVGVRFFGIGRGVFRYLERLISHDTTFRLLAHLRVTFYRALEPLAPARLISLHSGDLLSRVMDDIETLQNVYLRVIAPPCGALVIALSFTLFLGLFDPLLALTALMFMLAAGILVPLLAWYSSHRSGAQSVTLRSELNVRLVDHIQGMAEALVYGQASQQAQALDEISQKVALAEHQTARSDALQAAVSLAISSGAALAVLTLAIPRIEGVLLATVTLATVAVFEAFTPLAQAAVHLGANVRAAQRLFDIVDLTPEVVDGPLPRSASSVPRLEIKHVSCRYAPDLPAVLENITLTLPPGQRIAILGASGSGKSTLVNVLLRFWEYQAGAIQIDGQDLRIFQLSAIRETFGVMSQRTHLFNTTIRENIHLARRTASPDEVEQAAHQAQIHDFILSLPDGYETYVGEDGAQLSGGQRQRIALARVLLRNSPILILDEPTAHLDPSTERAVMQTILDTTSGRSLILLTHRRVLLDQMDQVYAMGQGRIVAIQHNH